MLSLINTLRDSQPFRYILIGGVSYALELSVLLFLAYLLHLSPELSVACSFWIGLIASFLLQKYVAFNNKTSGKKVIGRQSALYGSLVIFNYFFTIGFVSVTTGLFGLVVARTLALITTTFWNYFVYKKIFR